MRKLLATLLILIFVGAACSPKPVVEPPDPGRTEQPSVPDEKISGPGGDEDPVDPGEEEPGPGEGEVPDNPGVEEPGPGEDEPDFVSTFPQPQDVSELGLETEMTGWVMEHLPQGFKPIVYKDMLIFLDDRLIVAAAMATGEIRWVHRFSDGWELHDSSYMHRYPDLDNCLMTYRIEKKDSCMEQICLDTGELRWTGRNSSAVFLDESHYMLTDSHALARFENLTGDMVWQVSIGGQFIKPRVSSVFSIGSTVYVAVFDGTYWIYAVNFSDGKVLWQYNGEVIDIVGDNIFLRDYSSSDILLVDTGTDYSVSKVHDEPSDSNAFTWQNELFMTSPTGLSKVAETGAVVWNVEFSGPPTPLSYLKPLGLKTLWVTTTQVNETQIYAIDTETGAVIASYVREWPDYDSEYFRVFIARDLEHRAYAIFDDRENHFIVLDAQTGEKLWELDNCGPFYISEFVESRYIVVLDYDEHILHYYDLATGELKYTAPSPGWPSVLVGDHLFFRDSDSDKSYFLAPPWN